MTVEGDVAAHLAGIGRGTLPSAGPPVVVGTIFTNEKPASPDAIIVVSVYAGRAPDWTTTSKIEKPSIQVLVRGAKDGNATARALIETIYRDLDGLTGVTLSGTHYPQIWTEQSGPSFIGRDENGRPEWVWNFYTLKSSPR